MLHPTLHASQCLLQEGIRQGWGRRKEGWWGRVAFLHRRMWLQSLTLLCVGVMCGQKVSEWTLNRGSSLWGETCSIMADENMELRIPIWWMRLCSKRVGGDRHAFLYMCTWSGKKLLVLHRWSYHRSARSLVVVIKSAKFGNYWSKSLECMCSEIGYLQNP